MAHQLKLYMDYDLKEPVKKFAFPRTDVGQEEAITFFVHNSSEEWPIVDIKTEGPLNKETKLEDLPQTLKAGKTARCRYIWTPKLSTNAPLNTTLVLTGELHIG